MNTLRKSLLIGLTVLGMGSATLAVHAEDGRRAPAAMHQEDGAKFAAHMALYQTRLHDRLKLTPAQEPAWATFTAAAMPTAAPQRPDWAALEKMPAPQRLEKHIAMQKEHLAMQESRLAALRTFYAVLTPEQQKIVDESTPGRHHGGHGGEHQHRGMMR